MIIMADFLMETVMAVADNVEQYVSTKNHTSLQTLLTADRCALGSAELVNNIGMRPLRVLDFDWPGGFVRTRMTSVIHAEWRMVYVDEAGWEVRVDEVVTMPVADDGTAVDYHKSYAWVMAVEVRAPDGSSVRSSTTEEGAK